VRRDCARAGDAIRIGSRGTQKRRAVGAALAHNRRVVSFQRSRSPQTRALTIPRAVVLGLFVAVAATGQESAAQAPTDLSGSWTLDHSSSQFPAEIGFSADTLVGADGSSPGGGGRGLEGLRNPRIPQESQEDAKRLRFLSDEVRRPPERLSLAVTPAVVTITPDGGAARTVQPGRRDDSVPIGPISAVTNVKWERDRLTVAYNAETGRIARYTYSLDPSSRQLFVDVEFVGRGGGDKVRRVYKPSPPGEPAASPAITPAAQSGSVSAAPPPPPTKAAVDQRPDAPLKGLTRLGLVVEGIEAEAAKCGLKEDVLMAAVTKHLTDAGLRVQRDTDDDTYLYVNVNAVTASAGLCVSRYDVTLYSHVAAQLPHTSAPVLLQVELLHKGGLAGGAPAEHAVAVTKSVLESVDQFTTRIKTANQ
jgi:hypothetical protein